MKKQLFKTCNLQEVDFGECDLSHAVFDKCDLLNAIFDQTLLEKSDFSSSVNIVIDPDKNKIKKAVFTLAQLPGLLGKYDLQINY
jgi:uncharacterized protein YjbI with pentapeptide repeats